MKSAFGRVWARYNASSAKCHLFCQLSPVTLIWKSKHLSKSPCSVNKPLLVLNSDVPIKIKYHHVDFFLRFLNVSLFSGGYRISLTGSTNLWVRGRIQWWIQDFSEERVPTLGGGGGRQHTILPKFPKNCMKLKEFGPPGGGGRVQNFTL